LKLSDEIVVELTDHVGTGMRGELVDHGQWIVRADGQQIGYLSKLPNSWLACIVSMDEAAQAEIMAAVNRKLGSGQIQGVASLPPIEGQEILDGDEWEETDEADE
jgi:hypothetical protein